METEPPPPGEGQNESQERRDRYLRNLENLNNTDWSEVYPEEIQQRSWEVVEDPEEIDQFYQNFYPPPASKPPPEIYSIYRDQETGAQFVAFKVGSHRQVILDLLFAHKQIAPWSPIRALVLKQTDDLFEHGGKAPRFESYHATVEINGRGLVSFVNGLGDPKYTAEQKRGFLVEYLGILVHEAVHSKNEPGISFGGHMGPEAGASLAEYLVAPSQNEKIKHLLEAGIGLIKNQGKGEPKKSESQSGKIYAKYLILGLLSLADKENTLPEQDDPGEIITTINLLHAKICQMSREELAQYREKTESIFLSDEDEVMEETTTRLLKRYPKSLAFKDAA